MKTAFLGDKATLLLFYACSLAPRGSAFVGIWNPQSMPGGIRNIQRKSPLDQRMGNRYTFSLLNQKMSTDDDATIEGDAVPVRSELNTDAVAPSLKSSPLKFLKSKFTRKNLSAMGMSLLLSYGFVSNVNSAAMMGWVWAKYVKDTGMSPFIGWRPPFVTPKFLAYYGAIYITLGSLLRPVRAAIATGLAPLFNKAIENLQTKLKFSKGMAVFTVIFMGNIVFTILWLLFNVRVACWVFRVPVAPTAAL